MMLGSDVDEKTLKLQKKAKAKAYADSLTLQIANKQTPLSPGLTTSSTNFPGTSTPTKKPQQRKKAPAGGVEQLIKQEIWEQKIEKQNKYKLELDAQISARPEGSLNSPTKTVSGRPGGRKKMMDFGGVVQGTNLTDRPW